MSRKLRERNNDSTLCETKEERIARLWESLKRDAVHVEFDIRVNEISVLCERVIKDLDDIYNKRGTCKDISMLAMIVEMEWAAEDMRGKGDMTQYSHALYVLNQTKARIEDFISFNGKIALDMEQKDNLLGSLQYTYESMRSMENKVEEHKKHLLELCASVRFPQQTK